MTKRRPKTLDSKEGKTPGSAGEAQKRPHCLKFSLMMMSVTASKTNLQRPKWSETASEQTMCVQPNVGGVGGASEVSVDLLLAVLPLVQVLQLQRRKAVQKGASEKEKEAETWS